MRLVGEAKVRGQIAEVGRAALEAVERSADAHPVAVTGQRHPELSGERPTQPVRRDIEQGREGQEPAGGRVIVADGVAGLAHQGTVEARPAPAGRS